MFRQNDEQEGGDAETGEEDDRREGAGRVEARIRLQKIGPEPAACRGGPFADHRAGDGEGGRQFQRREQRRVGRRQLDQPEDGKAPAAHGPGKIEHVAVDRGEAVEHVDHHGEEHHQPDDHQLGRKAEAEPDRQRRRDGDDRHGLAGDQDRIEHAAHHRGRVHQHREQEAGAGAEDEAEDELHEGDAQAGDERLPVGGDRGEGARRRGHHIGGDGEIPDREGPGRQHDDHGGDRAEDAEQQAAAAGEVRLHGSASPRRCR
nr:hypothetical protein [Methylobrevis pamukkalensis]